MIFVKILIISVRALVPSQSGELVFEKKLRTFFGFQNLAFIPCVRPWSKFILSVREFYFLHERTSMPMAWMRGGIVNWNLLSFFTKANFLLYMAMMYRHRKCKSRCKVQKCKSRCKVQQCKYKSGSGL